MKIAHTYKNISCSLAALSLVALVSGCGMFEGGKAEAPKNSTLTLKESRGSITGGAGLLSLGGSSDKDGGGIGVNSFLWRASLDTLAFMPLVSADPFGGVIITDWYEDPKAKGERFKINALILDKTLRADGARITLFKQKSDAKGAWHDIQVSPNLARDLEDTILTRAREMRYAQANK
ncbi:MAG: DUF3576 domain-containing protein [Pseudomonadota bacterium]